MAIHLSIGFDQPVFMRVFGMIHPGVDTSLPPLDGDHIRLDWDCDSYVVRYRGHVYQLTGKQIADVSRQILTD